MASLAATGRRLRECDAVYAAVESEIGQRRLRGILVEKSDTLAVVAVAPQAVGQTAALTLEDGTEVIFVSLPLPSLRLSRPDGWAAVTALQPWPSAAAVMDAYNSQGAAPIEGHSTSELWTADEGPGTALGATAAAQTTTAKKKQGMGRQCVDGDARAEDGGGSARRTWEAVWGPRVRRGGGLVGGRGQQLRRQCRTAPCHPQPSRS